MSRQLSRQLNPRYGSFTFAGTFPETTNIFGFGMIAKRVQNLVVVSSLLMKPKGSLYKHGCSHQLSVPEDLKAIVCSCHAILINLLRRSMLSSLRNSKTFNLQRPVHFWHTKSPGTAAETAGYLIRKAAETAHLGLAPAKGRSSLAPQIWRVGDSEQTLGRPSLCSLAQIFCRSSVVRAFPSLSLYLNSIP